jgi:hypothetical protein
MLTLVDRALRHLGGQGAGSSVFLLSLDWLKATQQSFDATKITQ